MHGFTKTDDQYVDFYEGGFSIDGKNVISQVYLYQYSSKKDIDNTRLFIVEENGKSGLYRLSKKGIVELLPCEYDSIRVTNQDYNCFVIAENNKRNTLYTYLTADGSLHKTCVKNVSDIYKYCFNEQEPLWRVEKDGRHFVFNSQEVRFTQRDFEEIERYNIADVYGREGEDLFVIKGQKTGSGKTKDKIANLKVVGGGGEERVKVAADQIQHFLYTDRDSLYGRDKQWIDFFTIKNNGQVKLAAREKQGQSLSYMDTTLNICDIYIIEHEFQKTPQYIGWRGTGFEDEFDKRVKQAPEFIAVVKNEDNLKALASISIQHKDGCSVVEKVLTPYMYEKIDLKKVEVPMWSIEGYDEDVAMCYWESGTYPLEVNFEAYASGEKQSVTYYDKTKEVLPTQEIVLAPNRYRMPPKEMLIKAKREMAEQKLTSEFDDIEVEI